MNSPFISKINWTAALTAGVSLLAAFGLNVSDEQKVQIMSVAGLLGPVLIIVWRSFFTKPTA